MVKRSVLRRLALVWAIGVVLGVPLVWAQAPAAPSDVRVAAAFVSCSPSPCISSTSGSLTHGTTVTVSGAGFGTKAAQTPYKWDTMDGTAGAALEPRGWLVETNTPQPTLSATFTRATPGRTTSVVLGQTGADVPGFAFGDNGQDYLGLTSASAANLSTPPTTLLIDYWMYFVNGTGVRNYKFWRWHNLNNPFTTNNPYWGMPDGSAGTESSTMGWFNGVSIATIENQWRHHRIYLHPSSTQAQYYFQWSIGGTVWMDTDGAGNYLPRAGSGYSTGPYDTLASGDRLSTFLWEMQSLDDGNPVSKMYLCDIAVDNGYGAVYLGNASTWAATTHTEYQPYTAWADGSIAVTLNRGTFAQGATVYLYVVTNGRVVTAGRAIALA